METLSMVNYELWIKIRITFSQSPGNPLYKSRYPKFIRKLLESTSKEVRFLSRIVKADQRSNTCRNISYISDLTKLNDVVMMSGWRVRDALKQRCNLEPWRKNLLTTFMQIKHDKTYADFNMTKYQLNQFIDSLLISWGDIIIYYLILGAMYT